MKKFKFSSEEATLLKKSMEKFANDSVKDVAERFIGAGDALVAHSKGTYSQSYSRGAVLR